MERNLYAYEYVELDYEAIVELLERVPTGVLQPATESASDHARAVISKLVVPIGGFELARDVTVSIGELVRVEPHRAILPIQWHASVRQGLFPHMDARLEIAALSLGEPTTQVSLIGSYSPPAGMIGTVSDRVAALHRLADASVHRLVRDVCARLVDELSG